MTVTQALDRAASRLRAAGIAEAALDAELLLRHVLAWDRASILARGGEAITADQESALERLVRERAPRAGPCSTSRERRPSGATSSGWAPKSSSRGR